MSRNQSAPPSLDKPTTETADVGHELDAALLYLINLNNEVSKLQITSRPSSATRPSVEASGSRWSGEVLYSELKIIRLKKLLVKIQKDQWELEMMTRRYRRMMRGTHNGQEKEDIKKKAAEISKYWHDYQAEGRGL